jgi:hypothetical protein
VTASEATRISDRFSIGTAHLTLSAAVLYVFGFVVANTHFARFELLRPTLWQTRYLGAGLLFAAILGGPLLLGSLFALSLSEKSGSSNGTLWKWLELPLGFLVAGFIGVSVTWLPGLLVGKRDTVFWAAFGVFSYETGRLQLLAWIPWLSGPWVRGGSVTEVRMNRVYRTLLTGVVLLGVAGVFGTKLYPAISPAFGGGAVWRGRVYLRNPGAWSTAFNRPVAVIDRQEDVVDVMACVDSASSRTQSFAIPAADISLVAVSGLIPIPDSLPSLCAATSFAKAH